MGVRLIYISPGTAHIDMTVRPDMLNGHNTFHGGYITTLADFAFAFAFAFACNSYNELTVAAGLSVDFVAPAFESDVLTARAIEVS